MITPEVLQIVEKNLNLQADMEARSKVNTINDSIKTTELKVEELRRKLVNARKTISTLEEQASKFLKGKPTKQDYINNFLNAKQEHLKEKGKSLKEAYDKEPRLVASILELEKQIERLEAKKEKLAQPVRIKATIGKIEIHDDYSQPRFIEPEIAKPIVEDYNEVADIEEEENILVQDSKNAEVPITSTKILRQGILIGSDGNEKIPSKEKTKLNCGETKARRYPFGIYPRRRQNSSREIHIPSSIMPAIAAFEHNGFKVRNFQRNESMLAKGVKPLKKAS